MKFSIDIKILDLKIQNLKLLYDQYQIAFNESINNEITHSQFLDAKYKYASSWTSLYSMYSVLQGILGALTSKYNTSLTSLSLELNLSLDRLNSLKP